MEPTVKLSLTLTPEHAVEVAKFYHKLLLGSDLSPVPTKEVPLPTQEVVKPVAAKVAPVKGTSSQAPAPGGKTKPKMPAFGRSQGQVDTYVKAQSERAEVIDEEAEIREQRRQERLAKKAEREEEERIKKEDKDRLAAEVASIKATEAKQPGTVTAAKPWEL